MKAEVIQSLKNQFTKFYKATDWDDLNIEDETEGFFIYHVIKKQ